LTKTSRLGHRVSDDEALDRLGGQAGGDGVGQLERGRRDRRDVRVLSLEPHRGEALLGEAA